MAKCVKDFVAGEAEAEVVEKILGRSVGAVYSVLTNVPATASDDTADGIMRRWKTRCDNFIAENEGRSELARNKQGEINHEWEKGAIYDRPKVKTLKEQIASLKTQIEADEPADKWCRRFDEKLRVFLKPPMPREDRVKVIP
jgi:hypothetical protein